MTTDNLASAIQLCDRGLIEVNTRTTTRAFLHKGKWYPLRATVNAAKTEAQESELTTDRALVELASLLPYVRIENKNFTNNFPLDINIEDRLQDIAYLSCLISDLTSLENDSPLR